MADKPIMVAPELPEHQDLTGEIYEEPTPKPEPKGEPPTQPDEKRKTVREVLDEYGLSERYKAEDDDELLTELAKTVKNGDEHIKRLESENRNFRPWVDWAIQQQRNQPQQYRQQTPTEDEETVKAREFVKNSAKELLTPYEQQLQTISTDNYVLQRAMFDSDFAEAFKSGELRSTFQALTLQGANYTPQTVDYAYLQLRNQKFPQTLEQTVNDVKQREEKRQTTKREAFMEGGGRPQRDNRSSAEALLDKANKENLSSEQLISEMIKLGMIKDDQL